MPVPAAYTDIELKDFMIVALGYVATIFGWDNTTPQIDEAFNETLLQYGVSDVADASDIKKLRALARYQALDAAKQWVAGDFDFSADGGSYSRSQIFDHLERRLADAYQEAAPYLDRYQVKTVGASYVSDPYINDPDLEEEA